MQRAKSVLKHGRHIQRVGGKGNEEVQNGLFWQNDGITKHCMFENMFPEVKFSALPELANTIHADRSSNVK